MADYDRPKTIIKRMKGPLVNEVKMENYYRSKIPNAEVLCNPHPEVITDPVTKQNLEHLVDYIEQKTLDLGPCGWSPQKNAYVSMKDLNHNKVSTKMSFTTKT